MGTTAVIGLGLLAWLLLAIPAALFIGRMIVLRDRRHPDHTAVSTLEEGDGAATDVGGGINRRRDVDPQRGPR